MPYFYTTQQLCEPHLSFVHPSLVRLSNPLMRAELESVHNNILDQLEKIVALCDSYQRIQNSLYLLCFLFGKEHTRLNSNVHIDLMLIEGDYVLHLVDDGTRLVQPGS